MVETDFSKKAGQWWRKPAGNALRFSGPIFVVATLILGTAAYDLSATCDGRLDEDIYRALQHLALATDPNCEEYATSLLLNASRFLAAVLLAFAVIRLLFSKAWGAIKLHTQALFFPDKRYVLIGYGAINQGIARDRINERARLTIVDRGFDGAARDFAATNRVVLMEKDVRDEQALAGLHLHRARMIIVACGEDSLTLEIAQAASAIVKKKCSDPSKPDPEHRVFAHFLNPEVRRQFQLTSDAGLKIDRKFTGFSIREETARHLFSRTWMAERAALAPTPKGEKPRLHVALVGAGDLGTAMIREAALHGSCAKLGPPLITVLDREKTKTEARIRAAMPRLFDETIPQRDRPEIKFVEIEADALCVTNGKDDATSNVPITSWVICCTDDDTNLATAMRLEGEMQRGSRPPAPIYPRIWQANVRGGPSTPIGQDDAWHLVAPFGGMQDVIPTLTFLNEEWTALAKSIHKKYLETVDANYQYKGLPKWKEEFGEPPWKDGEGPEYPELRARLISEFELEEQRFKGSWEDMDDEGRLSNMSSAQQAAMRLWELGFDWKGRYDGKLPSLTKNMIAGVFTQDALTDLGSTTRLGAVCDAEHRRWMVERALRGWGAAKTGKRSNRLRLHPDFRSYDDLYEEAKRFSETTKDQTASQVRDTAEQKSGSMRMLDAASVWGIMDALPRSEVQTNRKMPPARPTGDEQAFELPNLPTLHKTIYRLAITVPDRPKVGAEQFMSGLMKAKKNLTDWMEHDSSFVIRFSPGAEEVWADKTLQECFFLPLHEAARDKNVTLLVEHADVRSRRAEYTRPQKDKTE